MPDPETFLEKQDIIKLKRSMFSAQRTDLPPVVTHNVLNSENDPVLSHIRRIQLFNRREDRVKVSIDVHTVRLTCMCTVITKFWFG